MWCRWRASVLVLLACCLVWIGPGCSGPAESGQQPTLRTVVLVTIDGLVPRDASLNGGPLETPALVALAREGRSWRDGWSASPMTRPAAATYLTGLAPDRHLVLDDQFAMLSPNVASLPRLFREAGFRTGAFIESGFLQYSSGLFEGFDDVDEPKPPLFNNRRWSPSVKPAVAVAKNYRGWVGTLTDTDAVFAWVHLVRPLRSQLSPNADGAKSAIEQFDTALRRIVRTTLERDPEAAILVVGTFGLVAPLPDMSNDAGMGFSLEESALQVPVVLRVPPSVVIDRPEQGTVWGPDIAPTLAQLGGVDLPDVDGVSLLRSAPDDRTLVAYSRAPLDELGWKPLSAARRGYTKVVRGAVDFERNLVGGDVDSELVAELEQHILTERPIPTGARLELGDVQSLLEATGLDLDPLPSDGRAAPNEETRRRILAELWESRRLSHFNKLGRSMAQLDKVIGLDGDALTPLLDRGFSFFASSEGEQQAKAMLSYAVERYPQHPESLRWYAVSTYKQHLKEATQLLRLVLFTRPESADVLYDLACMEAQAGDLEDSGETLRSAIEAGFREWQLMASDPDLRPLRDAGLFQEILQDYVR